MAPSSLHRQGHPLSRTYGAILQSSLTTVLPSALVFSTRLPVSVLVRSPKLQPLEAFLGRVSDDFENLIALGPALRLMRADFPTATSRPGEGHFYSSPHHPDAVPPSLHADGAGMLTCYPSSTPFGLD